jgi:hypothetical protein
MITDSVPWKRELFRIARRIESWRKQKRFPQATLFAVEKELFVAFYVIRKLMDAKTKLSFNVRDLQTPIRAYSAISTRKPDLLHWDKVDKYYELSTSKKRSISLIDLCNCFVHSYVFLPVLGESGGLDSILFNNDREKDNHVFLVKAEKLQKLFDKVANDDIMHLRMERDSNGEWKILESFNKEPMDRKIRC